MYYKYRLSFVIIFILLLSFARASEDTIILSLENDSGIKGFSEVYSIIKSGDINISPRELLKYLTDIFLSEARNILKTLRFIMLIACINAFITNFNSSFISNGTNNAIFLSCYCFFAILTSKAYSQAGDICVSMINTTVSLLKAAIPVCISLIASIGNITSKIALKPLYLYFLQFLSSFFLNFILPLINSFFAISAIGCISGRISIKNLTELLKKIIKWTMTGVVTLFIGSISIMGVVTDKVIFKGQKGVRFVVGNFVPIVGRLLSDTLDTVTSAAVLIKNTVGISGVVMIALICIPPVIKLFAIVFSYKLCSALIEPVCDIRLSNMLSVLSSSVELMLGVGVTIAIVFAIAVSVLIGIGG